MNIKLRKLQQEDTPFMLEWMHDSSITCNFQQDFDHATIETVHQFIENSYTDTDQNFAVVDENDEYLGTISLKHISHSNDKAEYAIVLRKKAHGTGVAVSATKELLRYAFEDLGLHKVYLSVIEENLRAQKMYEKCGFKYEGLDIDSVKINGEYKNHKWYGIKKMNSNISIIVFSKDRPMQLQAYLESLMRFSETKENMVTVIYCETDGIRYDKVINNFPGIHWVKEEKFEVNLKKAVNNAGEYIMFGCDDVVFTSQFSIEKASEYLKQNSEVFGFSMRLGANIKPQPKNLSNDNTIFEWDWKQSKEAHYNYPWELDCTLYRKEEVVKMTMEEENPIKNPNYYEGMITDDNRDERIQRTHMACNKERGCAVVITVNRVQETHQNGFDDSMLTDIYSLDKLYNDEDNSLDIDKIAAMPNDKIHVGAEYFILRNQTKGYSQNRLIKKKFKNIGNKLTKLPKKVHRHFERINYEKGKYSQKLKILNTEETLKLLESEKISFLRYGDGEIALVNGEAIPFQEYEKKLSKRLKKLLKADEEGLKIGIPYYYMNPLDNLNEFVRTFALSLASQRKFLCKRCSKDITYIDTAITQVYQTYSDYDFEDYYGRMQKMLEGKDITIVCGEGVLDRLEYKAFDVCKSVQYIYAPSMNAYSQYKKILKDVLHTKSNRLVCIVLGPTAKVLVYDLYKKGYQAWDMGHYFKDYDAYMKKRPRTQAEITQFYKPD